MITGIINWKAGCKIQGTTTVKAWSEENYNTSVMVMSIQSEIWICALQVKQKGYPLSCYI
jgi:hypothetical protein